MLNDFPKFQLPHYFLMLLNVMGEPILIYLNLNNNTKFVLNRE